MVVGLVAGKKVMVKTLEGFFFWRWLLRSIALILGYINQHFLEGDLLPSNQIAWR